MNLKTIRTTFRRGVLLGTVCLWAASCSTPNNVAYFQDAEQLSGMALQAEQQLRLRPEDKVNIVVNSSNPMLESQFTLSAANAASTLGASVKPQTTASSTTSSTRQMVAYTVTNRGRSISQCSGESPWAERRGAKWLTTFSADSSRASW